MISVERPPPLTWEAVASRAHLRQNVGSVLHLSERRIDGPPVPPERGVAWLADQLVGRVEDRYDAVCVWTGEEGSSKTTGALRLAEAVAKRTGETFDFADLSYGARGVLDSYRRAKPFRVIIYDEGQRGLLAGETLKPDQVVLTQLLTSGRFKQAILLLCIPDIWLLALKVRGRRAVFWVHVDSRGTPRRPAPSHALVHERDRRIRYTRSEALGLQLSLRCPELTFSPYAEDDPFWVRYSAHKTRNFDGLLDESDLILDRFERRQFGRVVSRSDPLSPAKAVRQTSDHERER